MSMGGRRTGAGAGPDGACDVLIVGGGPAGAATATHLARAGHRVCILERSPAWRWRAGGVFSSPATMGELRALGLGAATLAAVARPVPRMRVETPAGTTFSLEYGAERGGPPAVGLDRAGLDEALLGLASSAGATVQRGVTVRAARLPADGGPGAIVADEGAERDGGPVRIAARLVVGADGPGSVVAAAAGVLRPPRLGGRVGLSWHVEDREAPAPGAPGGAPPRDGEAGDPPRGARMVVLPGGAYCGIAPVPGARRNIGIVLWGPAWRRRLARDGAGAVAEGVLRAIPPLPGDPEAWRRGRITDHIAGASPLGGRVARRAGRGWLLVGDAAGFLDPFTGEGLHRALVSARLAAEAIDAGLRGPGGRLADGLASYDRAMADRFRAKDAVSVLVQAVLARPALFEHAAGRLARRDGIRETMGLVMGDLVPASRVLDPRLLAGLLLP